LNLNSQLSLGELANTAGYGFGIFLLVISIPMLTWFIFAIIQWGTRKRGKLFKSWAITVGVLCGIGLVILIFAKIYAGAAYDIASKVHIYIPMSVKVLENDYSVAFDGHEQYTVIQFNKTQMNTFIHSAKTEGWKAGLVVPYSLLNVPVGYDPMSGRQRPLPKVQRNGLYDSSVNSSGAGDFVIRQVYFLDVTSKILYVYVYEGQGP